MKSILIFGKAIIISCIIILNSLYAQEGIYEKSFSRYSFYNNNELVYPDADISKIFIVFNENTEEILLNKFLSEFPELKAQINDKHYNIRSKSGLSFTINPGYTDSFSAFLDLMSRIKEHKKVAGTCPYLIRKNDLAVTDNQILVGLENNTYARRKINTILDLYDGRLTEVISFKTSTTFVIQFPSTKDIFEISRQIQEGFSTIFAQPNFYFRGWNGIIPNDPYLGNQWFIQQDSDADIDAPEAWDITSGNTNTVVAIIDGNGYELSHTELSSKIADPYCAVNDNNNPEATATDENHGTPCAGLIGGHTNNSYGVASVGFNCRVLPVRIGYDFSGGSFTTSSLIIQKAGAHIVNSDYSIYAVSNSIGLGTWANIQSVYEAYNNMRTQCRSGLGAVILASTGNDGAADQEQYPCYFPNVVGVGNSNEYDNRSTSSNYGDSLDIIAPGNNLYTIDRTGFAGYTNDDFVSFSGTSAACPVAAGIVGLMGTQFTSYSERQLRIKLYESCEKVGGYNYANNFSHPYSTWNNEMGYGRVNASIAVSGGTLNGPENLTASNNEQYVSLAWTAPGGGGEEWLKYHDNTFENSFASQNGGSGLAQLFTLPSYPATIKEVRFFVAGYGNYNAAIEAYILSGDGQSVLAGPYTVNGVYNDWISWDVSDFQISSQTFMVATYNPDPGGPYVGVDDSQYLSNLYFGNHTSGFTEMGTGEYYYVGSHEVLVSISKKGKTFTNLIKPAGHVNNLEGKISYSGNNITFSGRLNLNATKGIQYYKIYRNNNYIGNAPNTNYSDELTSYGTYNYFVTAMYDEGESMSSNLATIYYGVGIDENKKIEIALFPNPANDVLYFSTEVIPDRAEIFTSAGVRLMVLENLKKENTIDISRFNNGLYLLKIEVNGKSGSLRFIVNNF